MVTFVKHFALNDQESCRDTLLTWANEQTIREVYLKPFRICVEKYQSHGIMSALNNLGAVWTGGNYALLTEVLRGEWGFDGVIITDYVQGRGQLNGNQAIRAGGDILLAISGSVQNPVGLDQPTTVANMRRAVHNLYYTMVNYSAVFNKSNISVLSAYGGETLAPAIDSVPYEQSLAKLTLNNGKPADEIVYKLKEGSTLPEGLTLSEKGLLTGTAHRQDEAAEFTVVASYGFAERELKFTLPIVDQVTSVIYLKEQNSVDGYVGDGVNCNIDWAYTLDGKKHDIVYSLAEGSMLPDGLTLSKDGVISGKTNIPFTGYEITVKAESAGMLPMSVRLVLNMYNDFAFRPDVLPAARFGTQYAESVASVSDENLTYTLKQGDALPQGLSLTERGSIVGVPQESGTKTFTVIASGINFKTEERTFTLDIGISYNAFNLGVATVGSEYEANVNFAQGAGDITYTLTGGKLPRGITLSREGILQGKPTSGGNYTFTITAKSGAYSESVELSLHVDDAQSNTAYIVGLVIGCVGLAVVIAGCLVYLFVIDRRNYRKQPENSGKADGGKAERAGATVNGTEACDKKKPKLNTLFIKIASPVVCAMLAAVIVCGVVFAPSTDTSKIKSFTFEAEYVYLDEFMGAGISNSAEGVNNIYGDGLDSDREKGWSNGYFLGNTYARNSIEFEITSDRNADGKLILRLASELGNMALNNDVFGVEVNGKEVDYSISVTASAAGSYDFADYPLAASVKLTEGVNVVKLTIKDNTIKDGNSIGAPLIDCIRITTDAELTWNPLTDNPENRGKI